jgi:hypothetical protein
MMMMNNGIQVNEKAEQRLHLYDLKGSFTSRLNKDPNCDVEGSKDILLD